MSNEDKLSTLVPNWREMTSLELIGALLAIIPDEFAS